MNRSQYLADPQVREFLYWARPKLSEPGAFIHAYQPARDEPFSCRSLFEAYEHFAWPFRVTIPGETVTAGRTFSENKAVLKRLAEALRTSLAAGDNKQFLNASIAVLRWGGVFPRNGATLCELGDGLTAKFAEAASQLTPESADTERIDRVQLMNAGFAKIYSLLLDGLPIYDGRVGAALGYLARLYCEDAALEATPITLRFAWGIAKGAKKGSARKKP